MGRRRPFKQRLCSFSARGSFDPPTPRGRTSCNRAPTVPKSKKSWIQLSGRIGGFWKTNGGKTAAEEFVLRNKKVPRGFKFHSIEWEGERYTLRFVSV